MIQLLKKRERKKRSLHSRLIQILQNFVESCDIFPCRVTDDCCTGFQGQFHIPFPALSHPLFYGIGVRCVYDKIVVGLILQACLLKNRSPRRIVPEISCLEVDYPPPQSIDTQSQQSLYFIFVDVFSEKWARIDNGSSGEKAFQYTSITLDIALHPTNHLPIPLHFISEDLKEVGLFQKSVIRIRLEQVHTLS